MKNITGTEIVLWIILGVMVVISLVVGADIWASYPSPLMVPIHLMGSTAVASVNGLFLWFILIWRKVNSDPS